MIKAIVFDKDGTLLDLGQTWDEPSLRAIDSILADVSMTEEEKESYILELGMVEGQILPNSILSSGTLGELAQSLSHKINRDREEIEDSLENFLLDFMEEANIVPPLLEGVTEMLDQLKGRYRLAIITNDNHKIAMATLKKAGILAYFDFVACADDYGPKPNSTALNELAREYDIGLDEMVYVGDSIVDIEFGKLTRAAIAYINDPSHKMALEEADYIIEDFSQLMPVIDAIESEVR